MPDPMACHPPVPLGLQFMPHVPLLPLSLSLQPFLGNYLASKRLISVSGPLQSVTQQSAGQNKMAATVTCKR